MSVGKVLLFFISLSLSIQNTSYMDTMHSCTYQYSGSSYFTLVGFSVLKGLEL